MAKIVALLNQYQRNQQLAHLLETQIAEMTKKDSDAGIASDTILDYRHDPKGRAQHIVGFNEREYKRKRKRLREVHRDIRRIDEWIGAIEDDLTREVFDERYRQGWSWAKIAASLGYQGNEDYPRQHIKDRYLRLKGLK